MKKLMSLAVLGLGLAGCSSSGRQVEWVSSRSFDQFTDSSDCIATVGSYYRESGVYTVAGGLYPFVKQVNGDLWVGVKSGGKYPMPVGDVQLRIDENKAWSIETTETPLDGLRDVVKYEDFLKLDHLPEDQKKLIEAAYKQSSETTMKRTAPYTVATGDKAKQILKEMVNGKKLIYRSMGLVQGGAPTAPGTFELDGSLEKALADCKIQY
jgi:hypothetical protein